MIEREYLEVVKSMGIKQGDILDIASDYPSLFFYFKKNKIQFDANNLIDALIEVVGNEGTVLVRAFNWDFCDGKGYDVRTSPSQVGELGNICLQRDDFKRTRHPLYSWMVKGKYIEELCSMDNVCSFGENSPWDFFEKKNAKMIIIGNTRALGLTCLHHIEQELQMPYRYEKSFRGLYTNMFGETRLKTYSMYVRRLDRQVLFDDESVRKRLIDNGLMREVLIEKYLRVATMEYRSVYEKIRIDLSKGNINDWVVVKPLEER